MRLKAADNLLDGSGRRHRLLDGAVATDEEERVRAHDHDARGDGEQVDERLTAADELPARNAAGEGRSVRGVGPTVASPLLIQ